MKLSGQNRMRFDELEARLRRCAEALDHMTTVALDQHSILAQLGEGLLSHLPVDQEVKARLGHDSTNAQEILRNPMVLRLPSEVMDTIGEARGWV